MPAGNYTGYFKRAADAFRTAKAGAGTGKAISAAVTAGAAPAKSTMSALKDRRVAKYVMSHPYKSAAGGMAAMGAASYVARGRRGPGTSKTVGRPTGMYKY